MKITPIRSLSEYIDYISKEPEDVLYRGENALNEYHHSSAFRTMKFDKSDKIIDYQKLINIFYSEISYKISEIERESFLAFSQHYGLPTNLLDMTRSPLVALFFACQPNTRQNEIQKYHIEKPDEIVSSQYHDKEYKELFSHYFEDWGYVYTSRAYIDVTNLIEELKGQNFINCYFGDDEERLFEILPIIQKFKNKNETVFYELWYELKHIISCTTEEFLDICDKDVSKLFHLFDLRKKTIQHTSLFKYLSSCFFLIEDAKQQYDIDVINYVYTISRYIDLEQNRLGDEDEFISYLPNLLYNPIINFERGRNQEGCFFFQSHFPFRSSLLGPYGKDNRYISTSLQYFKFDDVVFQIQNKEEILHSLDKIGINEKYIWCDYDHIASYIVRKNSSDNILIIP